MKWNGKKKCSPQNPHLSDAVFMHSSNKNQIALSLLISFNLSEIVCVIQIKLWCVCV